MNKSLILLILAFLLPLKPAQQQESAIFKKILDIILEEEIFDITYNRPPSYKEYKQGINPVRHKKRPDSISPKHLVIAVDAVPWDKTLAKDLMPNDWEFVFDENSSVGFFPDDLQKYSHTNFKLEFMVEPHLNFKEISEDKNFAGLLQFGELIFNKNRNYGILFYRFTRGRLDSFENLILLKKIDEVWKIDRIVALTVS